jgi:putative ABC transport system permease protein
MKVSVGDSIVIVATNQDGSVNGRQFNVSGILESVTGPGGRDGYIHIEDAAEVLRLEDMEISEIAIRLQDFTRLAEVEQHLDSLLAQERTPQGKALFEIHTWEKLSPFFNVARMIDVMTLFMQLMLIAIVLVSVMNVMIMAVFERIREIGTMAAIGTQPRRILALFLLEGLGLGVIGAILGNMLGSFVIFILNHAHITYDFGRQKDLLLQARVAPLDLLLLSGIVIAISVLASLHPAYKASKMEPITALRHL